MPGPSTAVNRVVVALLDGTRHRGFVYSFKANVESFYLCPTESPTEMRGQLIEMKDVKAIFFVQSHEGNRAAREAARKLGPPKVKRVIGMRVRIHFRDGEVLDASAEVYSKDRPGFFAFPLEADSNNLRMYIVNANVKRVVSGQELQAELDAEKEGAARAAGKKVGPPPVAPPEPEPEPMAPEDSVDFRVESVLRMLTGESAAAISEETGVPEAVLQWWMETFLKAGRAALEG